MVNERPAAIAVAGLTTSSSAFRTKFGRGWSASATVSTVKPRRSRSKLDRSWVAVASITVVATNDPSVAVTSKVRS